jgi:hypothetical protein
MASRYGFEGRVALVTGGADVHPFDLVNGEDVCDSAQLDAAIDRLSRLDILVCSAGVAGDSIHTEEISDDEWDRLASRSSGAEAAHPTPSGRTQAHRVRASCAPVNASLKRLQAVSSG